MCHTMIRSRQSLTVRDAKSSHECTSNCKPHTTHGADIPIATASLPCMQRPLCVAMLYHPTAVLLQHMAVLQSHADDDLQASGYRSATLGVHRSPNRQHAPSGRPGNTQSHRCDRFSHSHAWTYSSGHPLHCLWLWPIATTQWQVVKVHVLSAVRPRPNWRPESNPLSRQV